MRGGLLIIVLILSATMPVFGAETRASEDAGAAASTTMHNGTTIVVFGNRSLRPETVIKMSGLAQEPDLPPFVVKKRLLNTSLFSSVEVYRDNEVVTIFIHEKNTWFVLPYFSKDPAQTTYGIAFGKATIFGQDASIVGRFQTGTGNTEAGIYLQDESMFATPFVIGASIDYENTLKRIFSGRTIVQRTVNQMFGGSFRFGYRLTPHLFLTLNNYVERHRFENPDLQYQSGLQWSHRLLFEYSYLFVNEGLTEGAAVRTYYEKTNKWISDFQFWKTGISTRAGLFLRGDFNWILTERMEYSPNLPFYQKFELGGAKLRSFPTEEFRANYYGSIQNDILLTSLNIWQLKLRPLVFADWAWIQEGGRTGVGVGFQLYVRSVAVPAVQLFGGYGFNPAGWTVTAAIGPQL